MKVDVPFLSLFRVPGLRCLQSHVHDRTRAALLPENKLEEEITLPCPTWEVL